MEESLGSKKEKFLNRYRVKGNETAKEVAIKKENEKTQGTQISEERKAELKKYIEFLQKQNKEIEGRLASLDIARFIGKYDKYIEKEIQDDIGRLYGTTMMVHSERTLGPVSTRGTHIYNARYIGYSIAKGIFKDEEVAAGIGLATLMHDMGQPAFGHDGEDISSKASKRNQGGPRPHNATGAAEILYRLSPKIKRGIDKGIKEEQIAEEAKRREVSVEVIEEGLQKGEEPELKEKIEMVQKQLEDKKEEAVRTLAMVAGRHNGERGTANILPNYDITYEEFGKILERCFAYPGADKEMQSANMIDAIAKISDQISSIPYDMIDGKKGGLVLEIPASYAEPVSKILGISQEEALKRMHGSDEENNKLVLDIQEKLIESLVNSSSKKMIQMDLAPWMYGEKDRKTAQTIKQGLRMPTYAEYLPYTSGKEEVEILQKAWYKTMAKLADQIIEEDKMFKRTLNAVFRMDNDDPRRKKLENYVRKSFKGSPEYQDFLEYILQTSPQEYLFIKANLHEYGISLLNEKIISARKKYSGETGKFASSGSDEIEQGILNYMYSSAEGISDPEDGTNYSEQEVVQILNRINEMRRSKGREPLLLQKDERIASQLALGYIEYKFNDKGFIDYCVKIGTMSEQEAKVVRTPYDPAINEVFIPDCLAAAGKAYAEAETSGEEQEI